jgi:hypothetical protein
MAETKKEFQATDAEPVVLYGLQSPTDVNAIPILCNTAGYLVITTV